MQSDPVKVLRWSKRINISRLGLFTRRVLTYLSWSAICGLIVAVLVSYKAYQTSTVLKNIRRMLFGTSSRVYQEDAAQIS